MEPKSWTREAISWHFIENFENEKRKKQMHTRCRKHSILCNTYYWQIAKMKDKNQWKMGNEKTEAIYNPLRSTHPVRNEKKQSYSREINITKECHRECSKPTTNQAVYQWKKCI